jgi:hypothetical protein
MIMTDEDEPVFGECIGTKRHPVDAKQKAMTDFCAYTAYHAARAEAEEKRARLDGGYKSLKQRRREARKKRKGAMVL